MVKRVRGSDGLIVEFPDDTDEATINSVMAQRHTEYEARQAAGNQQIGAAPQQRQTLVPRNYPTFRQQRPGEIPSPEYERARSALDERALPRNGLGDFTNQIVRNLGIGDEIDGAGAYVSQSADNLIARVRGRQPGISPSVVARAAVDRSREQRNDYARNNPGLNNLSIAASIPTAAGAPVLNAPRLTMLQGGALAAGINAPFALGRQEGTLQERLPGAAAETAIVGGAGTLLQGAANRFLAQPGANSVGARAQEFEQAGVRFPLAAAQGRQRAPLAMAIGENPVGGNVRQNLQNSVDDVQTAYQGLVGRAGNAEPREIAGEIVQRGVRRFANGQNQPMPQRPVLNPATGRTQPATPRQTPTRDWSFGAKSRALYDDVFGRLAADEQAMIQGGIQNHLSTTATEQTLQRLANRVSGEASREAMRSPMLAQIQQALADDAANGTLRFQDLRAWRTWVREAQKNDGLRQGMANAELQQLERALTEDIYASAMSIGGQAADDLRTIDRWYRQTTNRVNTALQPFDDASGGAQAFRRVIDLASQGGRQNTRQLVQLRESLRPDEWRAVSASIMDELGNPNFGNPHIMEPGSFSLERFVTNVGRMSPEGRQALWGPQLAQDLERLARVAGYIKGVRGFANHSNTASSLQNVTTIGGVATAGAAAATGNVAPLGMLVATGLAMRITGEMLTNPAFVRWLTSPSTGGMKRQLGALATLASRDPALAPLYTALVEQASGGGADMPPERARPPAR